GEHFISTGYDGFTVGDERKIALRELLGLLGHSLCHCEDRSFLRLHDRLVSRLHSAGKTGGDLFFSQTVRFGNRLGKPTEKLGEDDARISPRPAERTTA